MKRTARKRAADLFCGAGGFTTGAAAAGVDVCLAVNHWRPAVYSHQANHPETRHICARIDDVDPRNDRTLPELDILLAAPECTHHSIARGGQPIDDQKRATPWHVCAWAEAKRPRWVIVENVREFRNWGPLDGRGRPDKKRAGDTFRAWIRALESLGYQVDHQLLNAADYGAATNRTRLFVVARRQQSRRAIPWPDPTHSRDQWRPAAGIIDWSKPCPSIFSRKRPLADKTLRRIETGLRKFVGPFAVTLRRNMDARSAGDPLPTITARAGHHALCVPLLSQYHNGPDGDRRNYRPGDPLPTLDTQNRYALACPYLVPNFGERPGQAPRTHDPAAPLPAVTSHGAGALAVPYLLAINHGGDDDRSRSPSDPLATLTAKNGHSLVVPFLTKYFGTGRAAGVSGPLGTITTRHRFGLVCPGVARAARFPSVRLLLGTAGTAAAQSLIATMHELGVVDVGFRMLDVDELLAAQGFPAGYQLFGTKAERVRQVGNSVCPPVAEALCRTILQAA